MPAPTLSRVLVRGILPVAIACAPTTRLDRIVERNAAALGGRGRLERLESVRIVRNPTMIATTRRPRFHKIELFAEDGTLRYAEGYDGTVAWEQTADDSVRRVVTGRPAQALWRVLQWPGALNPFYRLASRGHSLAVLPDTGLDGTTYLRLLLTLSDGFERVYFLNADTYLIERARDYRRFHAVDDTVQTIESMWGDYRDVGGYRMPFFAAERNYTTGQVLYETTFLAVQVNVDAPGGDFGLQGTSRPDVLRAILDRSAR